MNHPDQDQDSDHRIVGFGGAGEHFVVTQATFTADGTRVIHAFRRIVDNLAAMKPLFALVSRYMRRQSPAPRRTHRTFRRIVRAPSAPRRREAPAAPSALNTAYTRRYRNRQGHR